MANALDGLSILVPESRELDLFARMLEAEGATALRCPLVKILDLEDTTEAEAWIDRLIAGSFQDVIWLTGEGLRRLLTIADRTSKRPAFIGALDHVRGITRGPKPARALRELGIASGLAAPVPTSQGVITAMAGENIAGRAIGLQLYPGDGALPLMAALRMRDAIVFPVTPYRYASETETDQVKNAIEMLIDGRIGMIAFTSSPQVERFIAVARATGLETAAYEALRRTIVAAIGPVVEETLRRHGLVRVIRPETNFHLKPLVRAIAVAWSKRRA
jgi:uroporphyrinogen-III synthase